MSMFFREHGERYVPEYESPGRTKQSFKDECDVNRILERAQKVGSLSHLEKYGAEYRDFLEAPEDLLQAQQMLKRGEQIFNEAPSEIRNEFRNNPMAFFEFVNAPENADRLKELLPKIAEPGRFFPDVRPNTPPDALRGAPAPEANAPAVQEGSQVEVPVQGTTEAESAS